MCDPVFPRWSAKWSQRFHDPQDGLDKRWNNWISPSAMFQDSLPAQAHLAARESKAQMCHGSPTALSKRAFPKCQFRSAAARKHRGYSVKVFPMKLALTVRRKEHGKTPL